MPDSSVSRHLLKPENSRPRMAKVHLPSQENTFKADIGRALARALQLRGWTLKEFAHAVDRDLSQCGKWLTGQERAQLDAIFSVPSMRIPFVQAMAEIAGDDVVVTTTITIKRTA